LSNNFIFVKRDGLYLYFLLNQGTLILLNAINFFILLEMKCMKI